MNFVAETNQAYADQTTLNKRLEALEKRIEEHVSHGVGVPLGATVPPAPKNMYPPSGSGAPFDPPNYGIDLERFKKDIEAQVRKSYFRMVLLGLSVSLGK